MLFHFADVVAFDQVGDPVVAQFRVDVAAHFQRVEERVVEQWTVRPGFHGCAVEELQIECRVMGEYRRSETKPMLERLHRLAYRGFATDIIGGDAGELGDVRGHDHLWVHELAERVGYPPVLDFDCADFDEFGAFVWVEAGGFGVEHDVVEERRFQWWYASWVVASVLIPVAHGVPFVRFIFMWTFSV